MEYRTTELHVAVDNRMTRRLDDHMYRMSKDGYRLHTADRRAVGNTTGNPEMHWVFFWQRDR